MKVDMNSSYFLRNKRLLIRQAIAAWLVLGIGIVVFMLLALALSSVIESRELVIVVTLFIIVPILASIHFALYKSNYSFHIREVSRETSKSNKNNLEQQSDGQELLTDHLRQYLEYHLKNTYFVMHKYKEEVFRYFLQLEEGPSQGTDGEELELFRRVCSFAAEAIRASFLEHFRSKAIEVSDDISISVKLTIPAKLLVETLSFLSDAQKQLLLKRETWALTVFRDPREPEGGDVMIYDIGRNTALHNIFDSNSAYFLSNDLLSLGDSYLDENPKWREQYNATLVVPIRYLDAQSSQHLTFGFIAIYSPNRSKVDLFDSVCRYILSHIADLFATFFLSLALSKHKSGRVTVTDKIEQMGEDYKIQPVHGLLEGSRPVSSDQLLSAFFTAAVSSSLFEEILGKGKDVEILV